MAQPSWRNSGFTATSRRAPCPLRLAISCRSLRAVPTGAVLFWTKSMGRVGALSMTRWQAANSALKSAEPSAPDGVPTAMNTASAPAVARAGSA